MGEKHNETYTYHIAIANTMFYITELPKSTLLAIKKNTSSMNPVTMKNTDDFHHECVVPADTKKIKCPSYCESSYGTIGQSKLWDTKYLL